MKRLYSIILLISFLAGAVYPATPMIEYFLSQIEICDIAPPDMSEKTDCCLNCHIEFELTECEKCQSDKPEKMLDVDHYPIPLKISGQLPMEIIPRTIGKFMYGSEQVINYYQLPASPPPRHVAMA